MELEATWRRTMKVWWSYFWRSLIAVVVAAILGGIIGALLGFVLGALGVAPATVQLVSAPVGIILGLLISIVPMKLILNKNFGEFRLVLLKNSDQE